MPPPTPYEIVLRGRASARLLRPLIDDFAIATSRDAHERHDADSPGPADDAADAGDPEERVTRLIGDIRDASHLHGVLAHLTAVNVEVISIAPRRPPH